MIFTPTGDFNGSLDDISVKELSGSLYAMGSLGVGTKSPTGALDVRFDEANIWTGAGTNTNATSAGELYVEGDLEVDGTIYGTFSGNATTATTATNLAGGAAGQLPYQTGIGATSFSAAGTTGQVLRSGGTGAPTWSTATYPSTTRSEELV